MNKTTAKLLDELIITNIKIQFLKDRISTKKHKPEDAKKLRALEKNRLLLRKALDTSTPIKKTVAALIDELTITNLKIFVLVDKILDNTHTKQDAKKAQDLNHLRSQICNAINKEFNERQDIKV